MSAGLPGSDDALSTIRDSIEQAIVNLHQSLAGEHAERFAELRAALEAAEAASLSSIQKAVGELITLLPLAATGELPPVPRSFQWPTDDSSLKELLSDHRREAARSQHHQTDSSATLGGRAEHRYKLELASQLERERNLECERERQRQRQRQRQRELELELERDDTTDGFNVESLFERVLPGPHNKPIVDGETIQLLMS